MNARRRLGPVAVLAFAALCACESWSDRLPADGLSAIGEERGIEDLPRRILHEASGVELILVEPGRYMQGAMAGAFFDEDEKPAHDVKFTRPFYLARTEVTVGQWRRYVEAGGAAGTALEEPAWAAHTGWSDDYPVVQVSWNEAKAFCDRFGMQLPGEAQWEYAAKAGTTTHFVYGDDIYRLAEHGWYGDYEANANRGAHPVAQLRANPWGFFDMAGNVREWCADAYDDQAYATLGAGVTDPAPVTEGMARVVRGGSWAAPAHDLRATDRDKLATSFRDDRTGFRPMIVVTPR
ncbi:MAG: formylglycine-generating enzyme family protein [Planctomycetota bacterium]